MNLFSLLTGRVRGDLSAPGPHIIAGVIQPRPDNIVNLDQYRLHRGKPAVLPLHGPRVSPDALHPTQSADIAERPVSTASPQSGPTPNPLMSTTQTSRSVSQPPRFLDSSGAAAPTNAEGA